MRFWNDPANNQVKVLLLIGIVAIGGWAVYNFAGKSDSALPGSAYQGTKKGDLTRQANPNLENQDQGMTRGETGEGKINPLTNIGIAYDGSIGGLGGKTFAEICEDGEPHINVLTPNNNLDRILTDALSITWESCNITTGDDSFVKMTLVGDPSRAWSYYLPSYALSPDGSASPLVNTNDGSELVSLDTFSEFSKGTGGFYKVKLEPGYTTEFLEDMDGEMTPEWNFYDISDMSNAYFMLYENDQYYSTGGTQTFTSCTAAGVISDYYFRMPKNITSLTAELIGGGGGGGGGENGNGIGTFTIKNEGSGGGGGAGNHITNIPITAKKSGLLHIRVGCGGEGGENGTDGLGGLSGRTSLIFGIAVDSPAGGVSVTGGAGGEGGNADDGVAHGGLSDYPGGKAKGNNGQIDEDGALGGQGGYNDTLWSDPTGYGFGGGGGDAGEVFGDPGTDGKKGDNGFIKIDW